MNKFLDKILNILSNLVLWGYIVFLGFLSGCFYLEALNISNGICDICSLLILLIVFVLIMWLLFKFYDKDDICLFYLFFLIPFIFMILVSNNIYYINNYYISIIFVIVLICFFVYTASKYFEFFSSFDKNVSSKKCNLVRLSDVIDHKYENENIYILDHPISEDGCDMLDFSEIINNLKYFLDNCEPINKSFVLGLVGPWGSGKTSVINIVESKFSDSEEIKFIYFSPWEYNTNIDALEGLCKKLQKSVPNFKFSIIFSKYQKLLAKTLDNKYGLNLFDMYQSDLDELKDKINKNYFNGSVKYVIVIDDIDRISGDEFKLFSSNIFNFLDFKNCIYIFCYDEKNLDESLSNNYLDKIVNSKLFMPFMDSESVKSTFRKIFKVIFENHDIFELNSNVLNNIIEDIANPRDFIRFINTFILNMRIINEYNLNPNEYLIMEYFKYKYYGFYEFIYNNRFKFVKMCNFKESEFTLIKEFREQNTDFFKELLSEYSNLKELFVYLFPSYCYSDGFDFYIKRDLKNYSSVSNLEVLHFYYSKVSNNSVKCSLFFANIFNNIDHLTYEDLVIEFEKLEQFSKSDVVYYINHNISLVTSNNSFIKFFDAFLEVINNNLINNLNISDAYNLLFDVLTNKDIKLKFNSKILFHFEKYNPLSFNQLLYEIIVKNSNLMVSSPYISAFKSLLQSYFENKLKINIFASKDFNPFLFYSIVAYLDETKLSTLEKYYLKYINVNTIIRVLFCIMSQYSFNIKKFYINFYDNELAVKDTYDINNKYSLILDNIFNVINEFNKSKNRDNDLKFNIIKIFDMVIHGQNNFEKEYFTLDDLKKI